MRSFPQSAVHELKARNKSLPYQLPDVCVLQSFGKTEVCDGLQAGPVDVQQIPGNMYRDW